MTVADLITRLADFAPDAVVLVRNEIDDDWEIDHITAAFAIRTNTAGLYHRQDAQPGERAVRAVFLY